MIYIIHFSYCSFQPEDSNSKVVGIGDEILGEDTTNSISSVLRKEIEGKMSISNPMNHLSVLKGKESLGDSSEDAEEDFVSNTSMGSQHKDPTPICHAKDTIKSIEVGRKFAN